jgi:hypothetical protein
LGEGNDVWDGDDMIRIGPDLRGIRLVVNFEEEVRRLVDFQFSGD